MKNTLVFILTLFSLCARAQDDDGIANLRRYNFTVDASYGNHIQRLLIKPAFSLFLLDYGKLHVSGHYATQIAKIESFDISSPSISTSLVSNDLSKKFGSKELSVGYNFINILDEDATIIRSWTTIGARDETTTTIMEPGSKKTIAGVHLGYGSYQTQIFEHPVDGIYRDAVGNDVTSDVRNSYDIRSRNVSQYGFVGLQLFRCGKGESSYDNLYGGSIYHFCIDYMYVTNQYIGPLRNLSNERFLLQSQVAKAWVGSGIRGSLDRKGSGRAGVQLKVEGGYLPSPSLTNSLFFNIDFGIHITPLLNAIIPEKE